MASEPKPQFDVFEALGNPIRRELLMALRGGPRTVSELGEGRPISRPALSEHLRMLRMTGLAVVERRGRQRFFHLDPRPLTEVGSWLNVMLASWTRRLDDLNALAERRRAGGDRQAL